MQLSTEILKLKLLHKNEHYIYAGKEERRNYE